MARIRNLLCRAYRFNCALIIIVLWVCILYTDETIKIATWNIDTWEVRAEVWAASGPVTWVPDPKNK